ncbi:MAG: hypothetical protein F4W91_03305 [Gemmatimonadetes bacterium]|nr:hypothetical protein [Gemmatimonadota bacterium]
MRLEEQKLAGHFRFCENDYRYPVKHDIHYGNNEDGFRGELTIKEDGSLLLELEGLGYGRLFSILHRRKILKFPRIAGETSQGRYYIILLDCYFGKSLGGNLKLYPKICLIQSSSRGEQGEGWYIFGPDDPVEFDKIRFCMDGIEGFALPDLEGVKKATPIYDKIEFHQYGYAKKLKIEWDEPEPLEFKTKHFTFKIELKARMEWSGTIKPKAYCVLELSKPLPAKNCIKKVEAIKYFFGFLFDKRIGITNVYGYLTGHEKELLIDDSYNEKRERISGEVIKCPAYWNLFYEGDEWEEEYNEYPHTRYQNFKKDGESLLGKYLESFIEKYETDEAFQIFFEKYIYRFLPALAIDRLKSVADDCEYLFHKYNDSLPEGERLKGGKNIKDKSGVVVWKKRPVEKWKQIRLLAKPLIGCIFDNDTDCVDFGKEVKKYRNARGVTHFDGEEIDFSNLNKLSRKLTVIAKFHFLNLLHQDDELNRKFAKESKYYWIGPDRA